MWWRTTEYKQEEGFSRGPDSCMNELFTVFHWIRIWSKARCLASHHVVVTSQLPGLCRANCEAFVITFASDNIASLLFIFIFFKNDSELLLFMNITDCSRHFQPILILFLVPAACLCIVLSTAVDQQEEPLAEVLLACVILCWLLFCWHLWCCSCYKCWFLFPLH